MIKAVALITPSYRGDVERFELLCESIDCFVTGYDRHYVIVNDDDVALFARFDSGRRIVLPSSQFLPRWLKSLPRFVSRSGRRTWWSFRSGPLHGWHIQQLLKISAALQLPYQRYCMVDSDNVFFRPFDLAAYAGSDLIPLYVEPKAIRAEAPLHSAWIQNCDRLLGSTATAFPADDYIGNVIVWDKSALSDLTRTIEIANKIPWMVALCRARRFSEYLLYGHFVDRSQIHSITHEQTTESRAISHWYDTPLDRTALTKMIDNAQTPAVALCVASFSLTPVPLIRDVVGLSVQSYPTADKSNLAVMGTLSI